MKSYLQRISPDHDSVWFYSLRIQRDLLGRWHVVRNWGKVGLPGTLLNTPFETLEEAVTAFTGLKQQLQEKGYSLVMQEGLRQPG